MRVLLFFIVAMLAAATVGCDGPQSALDPAGRDAEWIARVFVWMTVSFGAVWLAVMALAVYAPRAQSSANDRTAGLLIVGGGVLLPLVAVIVLLTFGLAELPAMRAAPPATRLSLDVSGAQWWWRVRYLRPDQPPVEVANEITLPVGQRITTRLTSADVVHSFWIPSIAGKLDMVPGRINHLALEPTRTGTFRGACAEFCGASHAMMNLVVNVVEPDAFERWLEQQAQPASAPDDATRQRGHAAFFARGCNTCHTIRGTEAVGVTGPDLTHVGSRSRLAAGLLEARPAEFERWISRTVLLKPGVHMPAFTTIPPDELAALAAYLARLP